MASLHNPDPRVGTFTLTGNGLDWIRAIEYPEWMAEGLCAQQIDLGPDTWFPLGRPGRNAAGRMANAAEQAKEFCRVCPVRQRCLEYAFETGERHGIWGGLDEIERRQLQRRRGRSE